MRWNAVILFVGLATSHADAQVLQPLPMPTPWPSGSGNANDSVTRTAEGEFNGNVSRDAVALYGADRDLGTEGELVWIVDPSFADGVEASGWPAMDLDVLPGAIDEVVYVNANGLFQVALGTAPVVLDDSTWAGATFVRTAALDGGAIDDCVGVASDGRTVLLRDEGGSAWSFEPDAPGKVTGLAVGQYDGLDGCEICVICGTKIEIWAFDELDDPLRVVPIPAGGGFACTLRDGPADRFACVVHQPDITMQWCLVLGDDASGGDEALDLGPLDASAASTGDFDGSGVDDLALTYPHGPSVVVFLNQRPDLQSLGTALDPLQTLFLGFLNTIDYDHTAETLFIDLDRDGSEDALSCMAHVGRIDRYAPTEALDMGGAPQMTEEAPVYAPSVSEVSLNVEVATVAVGHTELEVRVYKQIEWDAPYQLMSVSYEALPEGIIPLTQAVPPYTPTTSFPDIYTMVVRTVKRQAGAVVDAGPAGLVAICGDDDTLDDLEDEESGFQYIDMSSTENQPDYAGGAGQRPRLRPSRMSGGSN